MGLLSKFKNIIKQKQNTASYERGLAKTRNNFINKLNLLKQKHSVLNEAYFLELEEILVMADIGIETIFNFMERIKERVKQEKITDPNLLTEIIIDELFIIYVDRDILSSKLNYNETGPTVVLVVGVNGVGKTTTIAKLGYKLKQEGKKVLLIAGDTFRAGAIEQLGEWGTRIDCAVIKGDLNSDPSSVIYKGLEEGIKDNYDVVLIDTAGRFQNKENLMRELEKINRVIGKLVKGAPQETLLVIDATTGQNGISQATAFKAITNITGIVLTKLDGTAKGGIVLAIKDKVQIPVKYIGLGERLEDLESFDLEKYIYGLFKDLWE